MHLDIIWQLNLDLGQYWLSYWLGVIQHLAITWTNVDFSLLVVRFCGTHMGAISHWVPKLLFCTMSLKIILLKSLLHLSWPNELTHWGRATHICVSNLTIIGSDNGLSPGRCQATIWTNDGILLIRPLGRNFSEISIEILTSSFKKMHLKLSSAKRWPFCLGPHSYHSIPQWTCWEECNCSYLLLLFHHDWMVALDSLLITLCCQWRQQTCPWILNHIHHSVWWTVQEIQLTIGQYPPNVYMCPSAKFHKLRWLNIKYNLSYFYHFHFRVWGGWVQVITLSYLSSR